MRRRRVFLRENRRLAPSFKLDHRRHLRAVRRHALDRQSARPDLRYAVSALAMGILASLHAGTLARVVFIERDMRRLSGVGVDARRERNHDAVHFGLDALLSLRKRLALAENRALAAADRVDCGHLRRAACSGG